MLKYYVYIFVLLCIYVQCLHLCPFVCQVHITAIHISTADINVDTVVKVSVTAYGLYKILLLQSPKIPK